MGAGEDRWLAPRSVSSWLSIEARSDTYESHRKDSRLPAKQTAEMKRMEEEAAAEKEKLEEEEAKEKEAAKKKQEEEAVSPESDAAACKQVLEEASANAGADPRAAAQDFPPPTPPQGDHTRDARVGAG